MNNGFIIIWRKFLETSFFNDSYAVHLAILLLLKANHESKKIVFNGEEIEILRGQCICGRHSLAEDSKIKPSTVRNKLALLKKACFLDIKSNNKFSIITILNYSTYQDIKPKKGQQKGQPEDSQRTARGQPEDSKQDTNNNIIQQCNNDNNETMGDLLIHFPFLKDKEFWDIFGSYLKTRKTKATNKAIELILKDLHKQSKEIAIAMLEQSIKRGWIGVFPLKEELKNGNNKNNHGQSSEYAGIEEVINVKS